MKRTLLCIALMTALTTASGFAQDREARNRKRDEAPRRTSADRPRKEGKRKSANQPRRKGRKSRRRADRRGQGRRDLLIHQFKHIDAESFVEMLKKLTRGVSMEGSAAYAVNEQSNTLVVLGPPQLTQLVGHIAKGVDKPDPRRMHERREDLQRRRRRNEGERNTPRQGRGRRHRTGRYEGEAQHRHPMIRFRIRQDERQRDEVRTCPRCQKGKHECKRNGKCPMRRQGKDGGNRKGGEDRGERHGRMGHRRPPMVGMVLHPRVANALDLSERQRDRLAEVIGKLQKDARNVLRRAHRERRETEGADGAEVRKLWQRARRRFVQLHVKAAKDVSKILDEQQQKKLKGIMKRIKARGRGGEGERHGDDQPPRWRHLRDEDDEEKAQRPRRKSRRGRDRDDEEDDDEREDRRRHRDRDEEDDE